MKKNKIIPVRITSLMDNEINNLVEITGFKKGDLVRYLINKSLEQLKSDILEAKKQGKSLSFGLISTT